jgi:hypothetical protein
VRKAMKRGYIVMSRHFKEGGIRRMEDMSVQVDLGKVFKLLKEASYEHDRNLVFEACFKNFDQSLGLTQEGIIAQMVRLALFNVVTEVMESLAGGEFDERDVLVLLVAVGLGLKKVSYVIEMAEKGLKDLYDEKEMDVVEGCIEKLLEILLSKMVSYDNGEEVMIQ